jgi:protein gp37
MAENSKIEWTTHTFNPWIGCTQVSPACDRCYAMVMMDHRYGKVRWGAGEDRVRTSPANWALPKKWNRKAETAGDRPFVFCASLADVFDNEVDERWRADLFDLIEATPHLTWLLLTKRIGNVRKMTNPLAGHRMLPRNAAVGATLENQDVYDRDRMKLREVAELCEPAFTFASIEPMLGPVVLDNNAPDWIICGGESGHGARYMDPQWARSLRDGSQRLNRAFFMKQMTGKTPIPADLLVRQFPVTDLGRSTLSATGDTE